MIKNLSSDLNKCFNDIIELGLKEAEEAENTKIALEKIVTTEIEESVLIGLSSDN